MKCTEQFTQRFIEGGFTCQAYGDLFWHHCFLEFTPIRFLITFVTTYDFLLRSKTPINDLFRSVLVWVAHLIPCFRQIAALCPPTKQALLCAGIKRRRHLYASMAFDTVKLLFIAWPTVHYGFIEPFASLNRRMAAYYVIFLFFQSGQ